MKQKYLVIGSGAIGGVTTAYLAQAGKDVTMIARGENLDAIKEKGLHVKNSQGEFNVPVKVSSWNDYEETPDIVIAAVKGYSVDSVMQDLNRVISEKTIIVPISNSLDMGGIMAEKLEKKATVTGGVAYIIVERESPGHIVHNVDFFKIVLGMRDGSPVPEQLKNMEKDFADAGIEILFRDHPVKSALRKFFRVSVFSAVCCYYDSTIGPIRENPAGVKLFRDLTQELMDIAEAMGVPFGKADEEPFPGMPVEEETFHFFMNIYPGYQPSMKIDWDNNSQTEIREQILDVIELGEKYGLAMPAYREVAKGLIRQKPDQVSAADQIKYGR